MDRIKQYFASFLVIVFFMALAAGSGSSGTKTETPTVAPSPSVEYTIDHVEDLHYANAKRFAYHVILSGKPSLDDMKMISQTISTQAQKDKPFNAINIYFWDSKQSMNSPTSTGATYGWSCFAPGGDWAKADTVKTGAYDKMSFNWDSLKL